jgi:hypothetical protein
MERRQVHLTEQETELLMDFIVHHVNRGYMWGLVHGALAALTGAYAYIVFF